MTEVSFARRVAPAVVLAAAGGVLLFLLPSGADNDASSSEDALAADNAGFPAAGASAGPSASTGSGGSSASAAAGPTKRVIKGDAISFRFGTVQVRVLLVGKTIKNIGTLTAPGGGYQSYTDRAIPGMKAEILAAQSTHVASVSGATYTSKAYAQSVQSALDKA
jgi:uncharacterized protein with FMN-binding domain